jgi:hypothetical protein
MASRSSSLPAPVGGWNARDGINDMEATDAVWLTNWYPTPTEVALRYGYSQWATGLGSQVETLMSYGSGTANKLFAIAGGSIYDVTAGGAVGAAAVSGLSNSRWQYTNCGTAAGQFLYAANGVDKPLLYNGTTWTAVDAVSTPSITGVTTTVLNNPIVFKNRVFFIEANSLRAWYLPSLSNGGAANSVDMSAMCTLGGSLKCMGTWTIDGGTGVDDYLVFVTTKGEVVVWQGTDPSSVNTWAVKGVWHLGTPVGSRCLMKYQGDLLYISQDGIVPMSGALQSSRVNPKVAVSNKIQFAVSNAVTGYGSNFGWQMLYFPQQNLLWCNVPVVEGSQQQQYVMNTITGAWCNFTGWNANCWELFLDQPYFGGNGYVGKAWNTLQDNGSNINASALQAFNYFKAPGLLKRFTMVRPIFRVQGPTNLSVGMKIDFDQSDTLTLTGAAATYTLGKWDVTKWDQSIFGDLAMLKRWMGVNGIGYAGAPTVKISSPGTDVRWESTDIVYEVGAVI